MRDLDAPPDTRMSSAATAEYILDECSKPEYREPFLCGLRARLIRGERDALRLYAQMFKLVGAERELALIVIRELGAGSEDEAKKLIEAGRKFMDMKDNAMLSLDDCEQDAIDLLKLVVAQKPERRAKILVELGG